MSVTMDESPGPERQSPALALDGLSLGARRGVERMLAAGDVGFLANPKKSVGQCFRASRAFAAALRDEGEPATLVQFAGRGGFHQIVAVDHSQDINSETWTVDWTPRQFLGASEAPWPRIESLGDAIARHEPANVTVLSNSLLKFLGAGGQEAAYAPNDWTWEDALRYFAELNVT